MVYTKYRLWKGVAYGNAKNKVVVSRSREDKIGREDQETGR